MLIRLCIKMPKPPVLAHTTPLSLLPMTLQLLPISTEVKKTKTKTIINRSQRYRLYAPVTAFTTEDVTEIRKSLLHLYEKLYSLTDISVKSIKRQDKSIVKFIVVEFYVESQAKKALLMPIPMTIGEIGRASCRERV